MNILRKEYCAMAIWLEINDVQSPFKALVHINSCWLCGDNLIVIQGYSSLNPIRTRRKEVLNRDWHQTSSAESAVRAWSAE